jgi:hypothetical protein
MSHAHAMRITPEIAAQLGLGGPAQPESDAVTAYRQAMRDTEIAERELVLAWSMIYCTCPRRYLPGPPEQAQCLVHGGFMTTYDGRTL